MPLLLEIVTPERLAYSDTVDSVQLPGAEGEMGVLPHHAPLLATLGRLCAERALWGKATSYLDASLSIQPTRAAHVALARVYERIGREAEANRQYRAAADPGLVA